MQRTMTFLPGLISSADFLPQLLNLPEAFERSTSSQQLWRVHNGREQQPNMWQGL